MPIILAFRRHRLKDHKFEASLSYIVRAYDKKNVKATNKTDKKDAYIVSLGILALVYRLTE